MPTYTAVAKSDRRGLQALTVPAKVHFKIIVRKEGLGTTEVESLKCCKKTLAGGGAQSFDPIVPLRPGEHLFFDDLQPDMRRGCFVAR